MNVELNQDNLTDEELVEDYQRTKSDAAFQLIYARNCARVEGAITKRLKLHGVGQEDVPDLVQKVFFDFFRTAPGFDTDPSTRRRSAVRSFLFKSAERRCWDYLRHRHAKKRDDNLTETSDDPDSMPDPFSERVMTGVLVRDVLETLPMKESTAIRLIWLEGCTFDSAGRLLGVSGRTVRNWMDEGLRRLRERGSTS